jgi:N-methylhydantoinase B
MDTHPIRLQVMANALAGIAEEMGARLIRGSYSANIKERRDCSTALFDAQGACIAQAAHIPVHLGALSEAVRAVVAAGPRPGDVFVLNDPYQGGSHLPDITVVTAIPGLRDPEQVCAYAVNRAHHADIGGDAPRLHARRLYGNLAGGAGDPAATAGPDDLDRGAALAGGSAAPDPGQCAQP